MKQKVNERETLLHLIYNNIRKVKINKNEYRYIVEQDGKYGIVDIDNGIILPLEYSRISSSKNCFKIYGEVGLYAGNMVGLNNWLSYDVKYSGLADYNGNIIVEPDLYEKTISLSNGVLLFSHSKFKAVLYALDSNNNPKLLSINAVAFNKLSHGEDYFIQITSLSDEDREILLNHNHKINERPDSCSTLYLDKDLNFCTEHDVVLKLYDKAFKITYKDEDDKIITERYILIMDELYITVFSIGSDEVRSFENWTELTETATLDWADRLSSQLVYVYTKKEIKELTGCTK